MRIDEAAAPMARALPQPVQRIGAKLAEAGFRAWVVGGCVRDVLLAAGARGRATAPRSPGDWDLATDARPEQVQRLFRKVIPTGLEHGTVTVVLGREHFEITTLRGETGYSDGRRPDSVFFVDDLERDLARRDFTVNAIAYNLSSGTVHDPFGGLADLERGVIRAVGEAAQRFDEDGLRVLRCARFASTLEMDIEPSTRSAIRPSLERFRQVARERVRQEWMKALGSRQPSRCFRIQIEEGMMDVIAPSLFASGAYDLAGSSAAEVASALGAWDHLPARAEPRLAGLLVIGCPPGERSAAAQNLSQQVRLSRQESRAVGGYLTAAESMPSGVPGESECRQWLSLVDPGMRSNAIQWLDQLVNAQLADARVHSWVDLARRQLELGVPLSIGDLAISGQDLIEQELLEPGPAVGTTLARLLQVVLAEPSANTRPQLLDQARTFLAGS